MLKKFSAALIVASLLAAPAMAAGPVKNDVKTTAPAPTVKPVATLDGKAQAKPAVRDAQAKMTRPHHRHVRSHRHARPRHRFHKKMGLRHVSWHAAVNSTLAHGKRG